MSTFKSTIVLSQQQFDALTRVDKVVWSNESFQCNVAQVNDYFTSLIYGVVIEDTISVSNNPEMNVSTIGVTVDEANILLPTIDGGSLSITQSSSGSEFLEAVNITMPLITAAQKEVTSSYSGTDFIESTSIALPVINSGSKVTTASYVVYVIQTEALNVSMPLISSGVKS